MKRDAAANETSAAAPTILTPCIISEHLDDLVEIVIERGHPCPEGFATVGGHPVYQDAEGEWRYVDSDEPASTPRPCPECHLKPVWCEICQDPHDACLGHVEGLRSACCGHGGVCPPIAIAAQQAELIPELT